MCIKYYSVETVHKLPTGERVKREEVVAARSRAEAESLASKNKPLVLIDRGSYATGCRRERT